MTALARIFRTEVLSVAMQDGANAPSEDGALRARYVVLTGTLTADASLVLPLAEGTDWIVTNATTGGYSVTVRGPTGAGVLVRPSDTRHLVSGSTSFRSLVPPLELAAVRYSNEGDPTFVLSDSASAFAGWASSGVTTTDKLTTNVAGSYVEVPPGVYRVRYNFLWYADANPSAVDGVSWIVGAYTVAGGLVDAPGDGICQNGHPGGAPLVVGERLVGAGETLIVCTATRRIKVLVSGFGPNLSLYLVAGSLVVERIADSFAA